MFNKTFKIIHSKYSNLFKFVFFLRYLLGIFFISILLLLFIPKFFDYSKKNQEIENFLLKNYNLQLIGYERIDYKALPKPHLQIKNARLVSSDDINLSVQLLNITPKLKNIYNFENYQANKIIAKKGVINFELDGYINLYNYFKKLKKNFSLEDLRINFKQDKSSLFSVNNVNYSNFGYRKNIIYGKIFDKNFKLGFEEEFKKVGFYLFETGVELELNLNEKKKQNVLSGNAKLKILSTKIKFDFELDKKFLKIKNSFLRNKNILFENKTSIMHQPFSQIESEIFLKEINTNFLRKLDFKKILSYNDLLKKINSNNEITYKSKTFKKNFIKDLNLNLNTSYGRISYFKNMTIPGGKVECSGSTNMVAKNPKIKFDCKILINDQKKLKKNFSIKNKDDKKINELKISGKVNLYKNEINLVYLKIGNQNEALKEDLAYFKNLIEKNLLKENFFGIFNYENIKTLLLEIS